MPREWFHVEPLILMLLRIGEICFSASSANTVRVHSWAWIHVNKLAQHGVHP